MKITINKKIIIKQKHFLWGGYRKSLEEEQINATKAIEKYSKAIENNTKEISKNTKAINEIKNEQIKTNSLLSELIDFFKYGKDQGNKKEDSNKNNITNQNQRTPQSKEFEIFHRNNYRSFT